MILSRNRNEEEKIVQYHVGQACFHQVDPGLEVLPMFCQGLLVDPYSPETSNLYRKFQSIGNFMVTQYFVTIVGSHFQWLQFHIKDHVLTGKQCDFSTQKAGKGSFFVKLWLEFQL